MFHRIVRISLGSLFLSDYLHRALLLLSFLFLVGAVYLVLKGGKLRIQKLRVKRVVLALDIPRYYSCSLPLEWLFYFFVLLLVSLDLIPLLINRTKPRLIVAQMNVVENVKPGAFEPFRLLVVQR
jgi:hypothetical protein